MLSHKIFTPKNQSGFTLVEIIVVIAVAAVIFGLSLAVSPDIYRGNSFSSERDTVLSVLQKARSESINNIDGQPHGVHFDPAPAPYILFEGATYDPANTANLQIPAGPAFTHSGMTEVLFTQLSGAATTTASGSFKLTDGTALHTATISVNSEGQINW